MSDKNENGKSSATAKDLLSRLQKSKQEEQKPAKKSTTYKDYIAERNKNKPDEDFSVADTDETPDGLDFAAIYDEVYAETVVGASEQIDDDVKIAAIPVEEELASDEYNEYFADIEAALAEEDFSEYAPAADDEYADLEGFVPDEIAENTYTEDPVIPEEGMYYEDVLPEDDFFDNDPIEEYVEEEIYEDEGEPEEYDEERDFEHLVEEVMGSSNGDELDETDISLMVALGMEDELAKTVGEETATQMTDDYVADQEEWVDRTNRFAADEYSDPSQNNEIADKYRKKNRISFWKMIAAFLLTVGIMFFENVPVIGYQLSGPFDPAVYPVVYIMVDLQILLLVAALVAGRLFKGLGEAIRFRHSVDCLPAILTFFAIVNSVIMAATTTPGVEPVMFNFVTALCLFFTALNEYMTVRREIFSFNIVSSKRPKFVMRRLSQRDSILESEAVADMDAQAADEGDIIKIQKTDFVDGYFWRTRTKGTVSRSVVGLASVISVALAVVIAVYAFITKATNPINIGFAVLSAAVPASMVIVGFYPFYRANRRAYDSDSTIIGEGSIEEYSGVGVISFDDVNVFPSYSVKVRNVRLFNNSRIDKVLYYAASVFSATGGPLADVFEVATMETGHSENVRILETGTGYIEAEVNGRSLMFGRAQALAKHGILIPDDIINENQDLPADCSVMYMIYQRKLVAKMIVNYILDPDFEYVLKQLTGSGMCVCVKTFDPNIDEDMILRQLPHNKYSMRVIKYKNTEEITKYSQRAEGGIVSRDNTKALLHTVSSCDKVISAQKTGNAIGVISAILNVIIMAVVLMAGSFGSMHSIYIVLCQLFWLIPVVITTKLIVR
ncbi:MAG: hypothetical protein IJF69_03120 [Clostridia bacterium]|nr:hypothetical protein [Clostridia bacterium]